MTDIIDEDYQPGDEYDWDRSDERQYCKHGTFIGSWWGPDLLCGFCEDGTTDEEFAAYIERRQRETVVRFGREVFKRVVHHLFTSEGIVLDGSDEDNEWFATLVAAGYGVTTEDCAGITLDELATRGV